MLFFAISIISGSAIAYQIVLMRLYSIVQWHHFAFMIISIALLGYGASGTFLAFARARLLRRFYAAWRASAVMFGVSAYGGFALAQRLGFNPLEISWAPSQLLLLSATYGLLLTPFFFAGNCIGLAFARFGERIGRIYAADLTGAGVGALLVILVMIAVPAERGLNIILGAGFVAAGCALVNKQSVLWAAAALAVAVFAPASWVEPQLSEYKGLRAALFAPGANVVAERHSPLGRISVVESPRAPFRIAPGLSVASPHSPPEQLGLFVDGEGPQAVTRFKGALEEIAHLDYTTEAAPYHMRAPSRVLVLGPGGGDAALLARYHRAGDVDVVEANPFLAALLKERFGEYTGRNLQTPPVAYHVAQARTFLAASQSQYDLIHLPLSASRGGSVMGGLIEAYDYTSDAMVLYLDHLNADGVLSITREVKNPPRDALKLMAAAIDALAARGREDPGQNLILIRGWRTFTLVVANKPFAEAEIGPLRRFMAARAFDAGYYPGMTREAANQYNILDAPYFYDGAIALLSAERQPFMRDYKFNLEPATDNRPYFNNFFKWRTLPEQIALQRSAGYPLMERGYVILVATLVQAALVAVLLIAAPLRMLRRESAERAATDFKRTAVYFLALGLAFLFIEIVFIQRFTLFLGHPIYAIALTLASFLVFAGAGAAVSSTVARFARRISPRAPVLPVVAAIALIALTYVIILPSLFDAFLAQSIPLKAMMTAALIAPLAVFMGMPFAMGLANLSERAPAHVPWAWGVNGCASVVSPLLATLLAIHWGFDAVIVIATGLYFVAAFAWRSV